MDNNQSLWSKCQELIRQNVEPHVYDVWFKDIVCERYDEERKTVVLRVPSRYVVEYIEEIHVPLMKCVLNKCFGSSVSLNYRLKNKPSAPVSFLREAGNCQNRVHISIPNARERLEAGLHHFLGDKAQWLPAYDKVAEWLTDNKGRGLLLVGTTGLGKTIICEKILPVIFGSANIPFVTADEMNARVAKEIQTGKPDLLKERIVIIDALAHNATFRYMGNDYHPFLSLCDAAERNGNLLIVNTCLSTTPVSDPRYPSSIQEIYGLEVISRLRSLVRAVEFKGEDRRP